jgi:hypothetical protein
LLIAIVVSPSVERAVTRTMALVLAPAGTTQLNEPESAIALAIAFHVVPPSSE